eukprot:12164974-Alexandrium_andersonii.AAC.1
MSASLVGSEMCIRDRPRPRGAGPADPAARPLATTRSGTSALGTSALAVSYTHLTLPTICSV